jgi:hypothetical protein
MFALCAAVVIVLALFGVGHFQFMLLLWLGFIALHFAFGWGPIAQPWTRRQQ